MARGNTRLILRSCDARDLTTPMVCILLRSCCVSFFLGRQYDVYVSFCCVFRSAGRTDFHAECDKVCTFSLQIYFEPSNDIQGSGGVGGEVEVVNCMLQSAIWSGEGRPRKVVENGNGVVS